jgi:chaperonin GroES
MNESGIQPVEYKVLIKPVKVEEKTKGGIILPGSVKEKEEFAQMRGKVIAVGAIAFTDPDWLDKPKAGDIVLFDKYAGASVKGSDGIWYRLILDKEIGAVIR